jgi:phosphatidylglycerophosphate synthase
MDGSGVDASTARAPVGRVVGDSPVGLWGMTSGERLRRTLARAGVSQHDDAEADLLVLNAEWVFDESLVKALAARPETVLVSAEGRPVGARVPAALADQAIRAVTSGDEAGLPPGLARMGAEALAPAYNAALRKRESPMLLRLTPETLPEIERRMFAGSYKGVTDLVTKYVWPAPALQVTRWCAAAGLSPNQVTFASFLLVLAAFYLFWTGQFGWGLAAAWGMTFLDTVDGKLARVTLTSSKIGNVFDHGIDLIHPPFWWWAWIVGLQSGPTPLAEPGLIIAVVVGGYVLQRMQEGLFIGLFKIEIHIWRRFDSLFRLVTTRRNPNLIMLTLGLLAGRPDLGMLAVAAWTLASIAVHGVRIVQAFLAARRGALGSWMA